MSEVGETLQSPAFEGFADDEHEPILILEKRVISLIDRYRDAQQTIRELQAQLAKAESRLAGLEGVAQSSETLRETLYERVTRLIDRVRELERMYSSQQGEA